MRGTISYRYAETLWRFAQVQPHATLGFRAGIREYVVDIPVAAAISVCRANPQLGSGSVFQYYIPGWRRALHATGRVFTFSEKAYP